MNSILKILRQILFFYSLILSTILLMGALYLAKSWTDLAPSLIFVPLVIFLWWELIIKIIEKRKARNQNS